MSTEPVTLDVVCPDFPGSAIAYLTRLVVKGLGERRPIRLFTDLCPGEGETAASLVDLSGTGAREEPISAFEQVSDGLPVFVIAGHPAFARPLGFALRHPGLVIMHDRYLWDAVEHLIEPTKALAILGRRAFTPGFADLRAAWAAYRDLPSGDRYPGQAASTQVEDIVARRALHVLTHTEQHALEIGARCLGGASWRALPSLVPEAFPEPPACLDGAIPSTATVILTFGVMTWNKCVDRILRAARVGRDTGADLHVIAAGAIHEDYEDYLTSVTRQLDLGDRVHLPGRVSPAELRWLVRRADAVVQLRDPVLNVGTASVVDALAMGKPVLVYDEGVFGTFPDDVVVRLASQHDDRELWEGIDLLIARTKVGAGSECISYVEVAHGQARYVEAVEQALSVAEQTLPSFHQFSSSLDGTNRD